MRANTVRAIDLTPKDDPDQISIVLDTNRVEKWERLQDAVQNLCDRFGKEAVIYVVPLGDLKMPDNG